MVYRCVNCSKTYEDDSKEILQSCACGGKFFFYIKKEKIEELEKQEKAISSLSKKEKDQMEQDVRDIAGITDEDAPIFLDFESVTTVKPGKYLIDLSKLFSHDKPRVYKLEDGKYIIDLSILPVRGIKKNE